MFLIETPDGNQSSGLLIGILHPARAAHREVSKHTDLVGGRSLAAAAVLAQPVRVKQD